MPDWTYHPFFKPVLFCLPPETGRRFTIGALALQSKTSAGRWLFRQFSPHPPPADAAVTVFGLEFPSRVGLGPGIDTHGEAVLFLKDHFGFGFLELGPVANTGQSDRAEGRPKRIFSAHELVRSPHAAAPSAKELAEKVSAAGGKKMPVGFALQGANLLQALQDAENAADFFTLPQTCVADVELMRQLREATKKPLLVRLKTLPEKHPNDLDKILDLAVASGLNGCVALEGASSSLLPDGLSEGPFLKDAALQTIRHIHARFGKNFPIIGMGGIMTPEDALDFLDAGAALVEIYSGFVFAGPGLPTRIVQAIATREDRRLEIQPPEPRPYDKARTFAEKWGWRLLAFTGAVLIFSGLLAFLLAATIQLLPPDVHYLGMTVRQLCNKNACRIVHFMAHDRVSFGGSITAIGIIYLWLAGVPLKRGESWSWWGLSLSGLFGFLSFLTYLGYGYLDLWHGIATLLLLPFFLTGLLLSWQTLKTPRDIRSLFRCVTPAWIWSPANLGRLAISFSVFGMLSGGLVIMIVGMTSVFVPQDLEYMGVTVAELHKLNTRLVSLIAHDRAGFGGGLFSGGIAIGLALWCGAKPGEKGLWWALLLAGLAGFGTAIGVHPIVGYVSFIHLLPAYLGFIAFGYGIIHLHWPLCHERPGVQRFSDV